MKINERIKEIVNSPEFEKFVTKFSIEVRFEVIDVRDNLSTEHTGVDYSETIKEIIERLEDDDIWAWCSVTIVAEICGMKGYAHLGCCSYKDQDDFINNSGYYEGLKEEAENDLMSNFIFTGSV